MENANNLFWWECVKSIEEIVLFINKKKGSCSDSRKALLPWCEQLKYLKNTITKKNTNMIFTLCIISPCGYRKNVS